MTSHQKIADAEKEKLCRWCSSINQMEEIIHFANMPLTDQFVEVDDAGSEYISNIEIFSCKTCGLVQNPNDFHFEEYYKEYDYSSGHSVFSRNFMMHFADQLISTFEDTFSKRPVNVLEVGSGDGVQLEYFREQNTQVLGVEPSANLASIANLKGVRTLQHYFDNKTLHLMAQEPKFDITLSSFTFDHIPNPKNFLKNIWKISSTEALLAFEIHDLEKISHRGEWCLFEHEHMFYTSQQFWSDHLEEVGFKTLKVNPIPEDKVRANSLIIIAKKIMPTKKVAAYSNEPKIDTKKIFIVKEKLENFITANRSSGVVGWGVGGRGVMTSALLENGHIIECFFDSNYRSSGLCTPKTNVPIKSLNELTAYKDRKVIVFSFGYFDEIKKTILEKGFQERNIISLKDFFA